MDILRLIYQKHWIFQKALLVCTKTVIESRIMRLYNKTFNR